MRSPPFAICVDGQLQKRRCPHRLFCAFPAPIVGNIGARPRDGPAKGPWSPRHIATGNQRRAACGHHRGASRPVSPSTPREHLMPDPRLIRFPSVDDLVRFDPAVVERFELRRGTDQPRVRSGH